jgi:hypothetical protein
MVWFEQGGRGGSGVRSALGASGIDVARKIEVGEMRWKKLPLVIRVGKARSGQLVAVGFAGVTTGGGNADNGVG